MKLVLWAAEEAATTATETAAETVATSTMSTIAEKTVEAVKGNPLVAAGIVVGAVAIGWGGYALYKKFSSKN